MPGSALITLCIGCFTLLLAAATSGAPPAPDRPERPAGEAVNGLRVSIDAAFVTGEGADRPRHPGEFITVMGHFRNVGQQPLDLCHVQNQYFCVLFVRTPDGKEYGFSTSAPGLLDGPAPKAGNYSSCPPGGAMAGMQWALRLTRDYHWRPKGGGDAKAEPTVMLGEPGVYKFWLEYEVPPPAEGEKVANAWSGRAVSNVLKVQVAPLPPEKRMAEANDEQKKWVAGLVDPALDIGGISVQDHVRRSLRLAQNEALARAIVKAARENPGRLYDVLNTLTERIGDPREPGIDGPYLKDAADLAMDVCEGKVIVPADAAGRQSHRLNQAYLLGQVLLVYLDAHPKDEAARTRIAAFIKPCAKVADLPPWADGDNAWVGRDKTVTKCGLAIETVWKLMQALGMLRDGMTLDEAKALLGEPASERNPKLVVWSYAWSLRMGPPAVQAEVAEGKIVKLHLTR